MLLAANDLVGAFNFQVMIGGTEVGFAEVSGLGVEVVYDESDGDSVSEVRLRPRAKVSDLRLRRAVDSERTLWSWLEAVMAGKDDPRTVTVTLMDRANSAVCRWILANARPIGYSGPHFNAVENAPAMEEIVVSADSVEFRFQATSGQQKK
ncbi:phage tail-like protein [Mycobacterium sp. OTB74]|nr:phage tail-like protein [Mycobacterium sp. OTB74]